MKILFEYKNLEFILFTEQNNILRADVLLEVFYHHIPI